MPPGTSLDSLLSRFAAAVSGETPRDTLLPRRPDARDTEAIVQDVHTRLWKAHPTGEGLSGVTPQYFLRLVTTASVDQLRRRASRDGAAIADTAGSPALAADAGRLRDALGAVSAPHRLAALLHLEGYSADDVALITGWSATRVSAALVNATDVLRDALATFEGKWVRTPATVRGALSTDDLKYLRSVWQQCRVPATTSTSVDLVLENEPTTPPEAADLAAALNGSMSDEDRVRILDRALHRGGADDVVLLHVMRTAAQTALPSTHSTPAAPRTTARATTNTGTMRAVASPAAESKSGAAPTSRAGVMALGGVLVAAVVVYALTRGTSSAPVAQGPAGPPAIAAPVLVLPTPGTTVARSFRLVWNRSAGASSYMAELSDVTGARVLSVATMDTTVQVTLDTAEDLQRVAGWTVIATFPDARTARSATQALTPSR